MDIISNAPAIFALTIFLISVAATLAASVISERVLDEQAAAQNARSGTAKRNVTAVGRAKRQNAAVKTGDDVRKAA